MNKPSIYALACIGISAIVIAMPSHNSMVEPVSPVYTLLVHNEACTTCGDVEIDSGKVVVPLQWRAAFVKAHQGKVYGASLETLSRKYSARGYRVSSLRLANEEIIDSLFAVSEGHRPQYRLIGIVVGLEREYLQFKVEKAVLVAEHREEK